MNPSAVFIVFLIIILSIYSFKEYIISGKILIKLHLFCLFLFLLLHYFLFEYSSDNYRVTDVPNLWDWIQFILAHALRAIDIIDFIEEYNIDIQNIHHEGHYSGIIIVAMHWMVDIFLLTFLVYFFKIFSNLNLKSILKVIILFFIRTVVFFLKKMDKITKNIPDGIHIVIPFAFILIALIFFPLFEEHLRLLNDVFYIETFDFSITKNVNFSNTFWWVLDNLIRTIDIGDTMQTFKWKLHSFQDSRECSLLSILFRLFCATYVIKYFSIILIRCGFCIPKYIEESIDELSDESIYIRNNAIENLLKSKEYMIHRLINKLIEELHSKNIYFQESVIDILRKVPTKEAHESLIKLYNSKIPLEFKIKVAIALGYKREISVFHFLIQSLLYKVKNIRDEVRKSLDFFYKKWYETDQAKAEVNRFILGIFENDEEIRKLSVLYLNSIDSDWFKNKNVQLLLPQVILKSIECEDLTLETDTYMQCKFFDILKLMGIRSYIPCTKLIDQLRSFLMSENVNYQFAAAQILCVFQDQKGIVFMDQFIKNYKVSDTLKISTMITMYEYNGAYKEEITEWKNSKNILERSMYASLFKLPEWGLNKNDVLIALKSLTHDSYYHRFAADTFLMKIQNWQYSPEALEVLPTLKESLSNMELDHESRKRIKSAIFQIESHLEI